MALVAVPTRLFAEVIRETAGPAPTLSPNVSAMMNAACAALDSALAERVVAGGEEQRTLTDLHREWEGLRHATPNERARRALLIILRMQTIGGRVREILNTAINPEEPARPKLILLS